MKRSEFIMQQRANIAANIRHYRHVRGWTQAAMAEAFGLSANTIYLLEVPKSKYSASLNILATIAHALDLPVAALLVPRAPPPNPRGGTAHAYLQRFRQTANTSNANDSNSQYP